MHSELIDVALSSSTIETLDLSHCDLTGITVPESLSPSLKKLDLHGFDPLLGRYVPPTLITKALASDLEDLDLMACNLDGITVPESLPVGLKKLGLFGVTNIPPALINLALGTSTIEKLFISANVIPEDLITKASSCSRCFLSHH